VAQIRLHDSNKGLAEAGSASSAVLALSRFYQSKHHRWCLDRTQILHTVRQSASGYRQIMGELHCREDVAFHLHGRLDDLVCPDL